MKRETVAGASPGYPVICRSPGLRGGEERTMKITYFFVQFFQESHGHHGDGLIFENETEENKKEIQEYIKQRKRDKKRINKNSKTAKIKIWYKHCIKKIKKNTVEWIEGEAIYI